MNRVGEIVFGSAVTAGAVLAGSVAVEAQQNEAAVVMDAPEMTNQFEVVDGVILAIGELPSRVCILPNPNIPEGQPGWCNDWGPEDPPAPQPTNPPAPTPTNPPSGGSGGGNSGGGSGGGSSGNSGGSNGGGSGGSSGAGSGSGGSSGSGSSGGGGETYVAPPKPWDQQLAEAYPEQCAENHPINAFLNPASNDAEGLASPAQLNVEAQPETWTFDYFLQQLEADRIDPETGERGDSGRLVVLSEGCPGVYTPISPSEWTEGLNWSFEDYEAFATSNGRFPTALDIIVNVEADEWNITPPERQWVRAATEAGTIQDRWFAAEGITAEQFLNGEIELGALPATGFANPEN